MQLSNSYETIIVLYSGLSAPVAADIESKFSETALGNVMLADYRNFAHGRHLWLDRRGDRTLIVALITPEDNRLSAKTLSFIPESVPIIKLETKSPGIKGMLELLLGAFKLTKKIGLTSGFDPGRPNVPEYGKKMYHYRYLPTTYDEFKQNASLPNSALIKKCGTTSLIIADLYRRHYFDFVDKLCLAKFNQLIFDYDSTLRESDSPQEVEDDIFMFINDFLSNGISIAVATGRGKSVRTELQRKISCKYWGRVTIGYYNGGDISLLSDNESPNNNIDVFPPLQTLANELECYCPNLEFDLRPRQITISTDIARYKDAVLELARKHDKLKAFMSGHSVDIVPIKTSKLNLVTRNNMALCIGDSGQYGGNDYELLSHEYSLSVNRTSMSFDSCWNLAPLGVDNSQATLYYLRCMRVIDNSLKFEIKGGGKIL